MQSHDVEIVSFLIINDYADVNQYFLKQAQEQYEI